MLLKTRKGARFEEFAKLRNINLIPSKHNIDDTVIKQCKYDNIYP